MQHISVELVGSVLEVGGPNLGPLELQIYGETYPGSASVLNQMHYNAQFGWVVEGFWLPPLGSGVWIELTDQTAGLETYRGGTFEPIFTTAGSERALPWNGVMLHNWYAASRSGMYEATYLVYLGDEQTGEPTPGFSGADITLTWELPCYADCDRSGSLDVFDFLCFQDAFVTGESYADCTGEGVFDIFDFLCFQDAFVTGCQ